MVCVNNLLVVCYSQMLVFLTPHISLEEFHYIGAESIMIPQGGGCMGDLKKKAKFYFHENIVNISQFTVLKYDCKESTWCLCWYLIC